MILQVGVPDEFGPSSGGIVNGTCNHVSRPRIRSAAESPLLGVIWIGGATFRCAQASSSRAVIDTGMAASSGSGSVATICGSTASRSGS